MNESFLTAVGDRLNEIGVPCVGPGGLEDGVYRLVSQGGGRMFVRRIAPDEMVILFKLDNHEDRSPGL